MDNSIPALERAIQILETLEVSPDGVSAAALARVHGIPRTSLYRILRVLGGKGFVAAASADSASYVLGPAIVRLAIKVRISANLAARAQPVMEVLSSRLGETVKLVVREGLETVAIAVVHSRRDSRIATRVGIRQPLHVGSSQRLLLARAPAETIAAVLANPLQKRASRTITRPALLRKNIEELAQREWDFGHSEGTEGVGTVAALVHDGSHSPLAALVVVFIQSGKSRKDILAMRDATLTAARELSSR